MSEPVSQRQIPSRPPAIQLPELQRRILFSLLKPAVRLARRMGIGLKETRDWLELAYYDELRRDGLTLQDAADAAQISRRKTAQLSKGLKENFFDPEREAELPRRIEFILWAGPLTEGRLRQALREHAPEEIDDALALLREQGRVEVTHGRAPLYRVPRSEFRLYRGDWISRIDGLNNQLAVIERTVRARFFDDDERAFQRTLNLRVRPEDQKELEQLYREVVYPRLAELDERARQADDSDTMGFSMSWAPDDGARTDEER